jgi:hypothetical protein
MIGLAAVIATLAVGLPGQSAPDCGKLFGAFPPIVSLPCLRPYTSASVFNRRLPARPPVAGDSTSIVSNLTSNGIHFPGGATGFALTTSDARIAVYYSQPTDLLVRIRCTFQFGPNTCTGANGYDIDGRLVRVPSVAEPAPGTDKHMTIVDPANGREYDFEHATWARGHHTLDVWSGAEVAIGSDAGTGLGSGATAADFANLAGLITAPELAAGQIDHALSIVLPCTRGYVYPATLANGFPCSRMPSYREPGDAGPLGALLQLDMSDAQIAASGAPAWEQTIMTAMAHYGMYVNDTGDPGDPVDIGLEALSDVSSTVYGAAAPLAGFVAASGGSYYAPAHQWTVLGPAIPVTALRVISPCFARGTCESRWPH